MNQTAEEILKYIEEQHKIILLEEENLKQTKIESEISGFMCILLMNQLSGFENAYKKCIKFLENNY
jgi:hypothetical protein